MGTKCPQCDKPGGALTAVPHCKNHSCDWNICNCGATYSRKTGQGFGTIGKKNIFYPASPR